MNNETAREHKLCCDCYFWRGSCPYHVNTIASNPICERFLPKVGNEYRPSKSDYSVFGGKAKYLQTEILKVINELGEVRKTLKGQKEEEQHD